MACITAETATLAFAIINIFIVSLSTASSLGMLIFWIVTVARLYGTHEKLEPYIWGSICRDLGGILAWLTVSLIALVFSSFLLNGSIKKKPQHIKAYYIYGVVKICFAVLTMVFMCTVVSIFGGFNAIDYTPALIVIAVFSIYGLILHMVRHTYQKMENENGQFTHKPLNEKC